MHRIVVVDAKEYAARVEAGVSVTGKEGINFDEGKVVTRSDRNILQIVLAPKVGSTTSIFG